MQIECSQAGTHGNPFENCNECGWTSDVDAVNTLNEYMITSGKNLPNHSTSQMGRGKFVKAGSHETPVFRTKQSAYRFCAWILIQVDIGDLPDEEGAHTFEQVMAAIRNS